MDPLAILPQHVRSIVTSTTITNLPLPRSIREDYAVVAIIDISGYSKLSSTLESALGSDSAAQIKEVINAPMDLITSYVHKYGGSIVKLAGDAVIASWTMDPDTNIPLFQYQKALCLNVFLCSLELLELFREYSIAIDLPSKTAFSNHINTFTQSLKIHIGLALGPMDHIHIGGRTSGMKRTNTRRRISSTHNNNASYGRREYFIAGEALAAAGNLLNAGKQGDFVFSRNFNEVLLETMGVSGMPMAGDAFKISEKNALSDLQLKAFKYLLPLKNCGIESRENKLSPIHARHVQYLSYAKSYMDDSIAKLMREGAVVGDQLRSVSVVFLKLGGFQSENVAEPQNLKKLQAASILIMRKVQEYEGCVRQFNCDDKALTALLVWGLEGQAHEKGESYVAMLAATEIAKHLGACVDDPMGFSIGVTTGVVFSGIVGSKQRCDNTILGVVVNNAARLMCLDKCQGTVLCDQETYRKTFTFFKYVTDIPLVELKGVPHPVKIYNAVGDSPAIKENLHLSLSGRKKELEILTRSLHIWRSGEAATKSAVLLGTSGIGKSHVTSWLQEQIDDTEILCVGLALEHKRESLLFCWTRIFQSFLDQISSNSEILARLSTRQNERRLKSDDISGNEDSWPASRAFEDNGSVLSSVLSKERHLAEPAGPSKRPHSGRSEQINRSGLHINTASKVDDSDAKSDCDGQEMTICLKEMKGKSKSRPTSGRSQTSPTTTEGVKFSEKRGRLAESDEVLSSVPEAIVKPKRPWSGRSDRTGGLASRGHAKNNLQGKIMSNTAVKHHGSDSFFKISTVTSTGTDNPTMILSLNNSTEPGSLDSFAQTGTHSQENLTTKELEDSTFLKTVNARSGKSSSRNSYAGFRNSPQPQRADPMNAAREQTSNPFSYSLANSDENLSSKSQFRFLSMLIGKSDILKSSTRQSGLGLKLFTVEPKSRASYFDRMSISNGSDSSSLKEKLPKLLRILTTLNIPLSSIETLAPITGFGGSQTFVNGVESIAAVLSDIFNSFSDIGLKLCFILDDIQWCDSFSLELSCLLLQKCPSVLFLFAARPLEEWRSSSAQHLRTILQEDVHKIDLLPLDETEVEHLLRSKVSPVMEFIRISKEMINELLNRSQGNPMVTNVLINTLIEDGLLNVEHGMLVCTRFKEVQVGFSPGAAVVAQFDKLSAPMKFVLRVCAISGQHFKLDEICANLAIFHASGEFSGIQTTIPAILELLRSEDKYKFLKYTDDENEMCFSHYLIQQAILSSMVPVNRDAIRKAFIQYYETAIVTAEGAAKSSYRQSLIYFLLKVPGYEDKKCVHIYEAFLEFGEMNQSVEALEYYGMLEQMTGCVELADTCLKKVKEYRILARLYFERGNCELALSYARKGLSVLGCKASVVHPSALSILGSVYWLGKRTEKILQMHVERPAKAAALALLHETFPNTELFSAASQRPSKYMRPMNEDEQDKIFSEIISVLCVMKSVFEQTKPGLEDLLASLLMTAPSLLSRQSVSYHMCYFFTSMSISSKLMKVDKLSSLSQDGAERLMNVLSTEEMLRSMTLYETFLFANACEGFAMQKIMDADLHTAAQYFRHAYTLTTRQGLGNSEKAFQLAEMTRMVLQAMGYDDDVAWHWFDAKDHKFYTKNMTPQAIAGAQFSIASSLVRLRDFERLSALEEEARSNLQLCKGEFKDALCCFQLHIHALCVSVYTASSASILDSLKAIEGCMKLIPARCIVYPSWLQFLLVISEFRIMSLRKKAALTPNSHQVRESAIRILKAAKAQANYPKTPWSSYIQSTAQATLDLWNRDKCDTFIAKAQKSISQGAATSVPQVQILLLGSRVWQARGLSIAASDTGAVTRWKSEGERIKGEILQTGLRLDLETYLIDRLLQGQ
ncbi:Adenylate cyclase type 10 [Chytriomyces hyalinus]|nr:Adenylate cyclase type 10 [Chytriomyces hyalinus]